MTTKENTRILIYEAFLPYAFKMEGILFANSYFNTNRETDLIRILISVMATASSPEIIIVANKMGERKDLDLLHLLKQSEAKIPVIIFISNEDYHTELTKAYKNVFCVKHGLNQESLLEAIETIMLNKSAIKKTSF